MFGLPSLTIAAVGGTVLIILFALVYWTLTFKEPVS
jgi:hypothetical protein